MSDRHTSLVGSLVRQVKARNKAKVDSRVKSRVRLAAILKMEQLETRWVPALITWDGGAGTLNWADSANWNTDSQPTSSDDVLIPNSSSDVYTINVNTSPNIRSISDHKGLAILSGYTLSVTTGASFVAGEFSNSGRLNASGAGTTFTASTSIYGDSGYFYASRDAGRSPVRLEARVP